MNCTFCKVDRIYAVRIPGLAGELCECGKWIGNCRRCDRQVLEMDESGCCPKCAREKLMAKRQGKK